MKYDQILATDLCVSQLTLGTWVFSGLNWGGADEKDCMAAVDTAIDSGVNLIDTAPIYGYGLAETIVGKAIKGKRDKVVIATKCGLSGRGKRVYNDLNPKTIVKELEDSLLRLQTDYIDIYQCHWPDPNTPVEETIKCLQLLQECGKIRYIGVSNFGFPLLQEVIHLNAIKTLQSPLSLLDRSLKKEIIPFCHRNEVGILAYGSLGGGILTGKYDEPKSFAKDDARSFFYKFYDGDKFQRIRGFLDKLGSLGKPLNQVAINWVRQQPGVSSAIVGSRNAEQVLKNIAAADWDLSDDELAFIDGALQEFGL